MPTLVVYGATSYTATRHLLPYLANHEDASKFELVLAGRNAGRLEAANALLPSSSRKIVALSLDDSAAVDALVTRADAVINLAGPYSKHNAIALVEACARLGKHYFDLTGEVFWVKNAVLQYDYLAAKTGACIVPMCGFEALPGDITIYSALKTLQKNEGRDVGIRSSTNYYDISGGVSGGTIASVKAFAESDSRDSNEWSLIDGSRQGIKSPQRLVYRGPNLPNVPRYGAFYVGGLPNLSVYRRSWHLSQLTGSVISLSGESKFSAAELAAEPRHGDYTEFHEALSRIDKKECTSWLGTLWLSLVVLISAGLYISSSFVRRLAEPFIPQPGEGPAMEACERGWTRITNISAADVPDGADGDVPITVVTRYTAKGDPGYSHTAKILAEAALSVILPPLPGTTRPPLARVGGVLTPSTAGGAVLVERLRKFGVAQIESEIVDPDAEPKKTI